jgi:uncharacterized protein (TIGR03437 family)
LVVALSSLPIASQIFTQGTTSLAAGKDVTPSNAEAPAQTPQTCVQPPSGIVSWWFAEGNANDLRDGNHGQLEGGAGYAAGHVGRAFSFEGTGQVRVANNANLNVQTFTIEAWVYPALVDGVLDTIVCKEPDASVYQYYLAIRGPDNRAGVGTIPRGNLAFTIVGVNGLPTDATLGWVDGGGQVPLFAWTHVALTFDGNSAKAYLNGVLTRNIAGLSGMVNVTSGPLRIGSRSDFAIGVVPQDRFNGLIDEVALYNRALSASEIQSIFNAGRFGKCKVTNVSAASFRENPIASESIVASFGVNLATATQSAPSLPLPTTLAGTSVRVNGVLAPLFFVSPTQVNYQLPPGTVNGTAGVAITNSNNLVSHGAAQVASVAPGLFSANADGQGVAAAVVLRVKPDGSQSFEPAVRFDPAQGKFFSVPIDPGPESDQVILILFGNGFRFRSLLSAVTVRIGGVETQVFYANLAPGFVGLDQANVLLPRSLTGRGEVDVVMTVDGQAANTVRVAIK